MSSLKNMSNVIYKDDEEYPELLRRIGKDAPKQLYYKVRFKKSNQARPYSHNLATQGCSSVRHVPAHLSNARPIPVHLFDNCLAVVGSRKLTHYGQQVIERIVGQVASAGITIVSGFMYGGDAVAHKTALKVGGRTIAVMPCGIDRISPEDQEDLYNEIIENNGMIISEYEGDMAPALWTYPRRNRIVAGLSKAVLVIEAGEKSGSLITANLAKKFKRKIFAVPGPITSSVSIGTNMLIKQGAEMVTSAQDILRWFRGLTQRRRPENDALVLKGHHFTGQASSDLRVDVKGRASKATSLRSEGGRLCLRGTALIGVEKNILDLLEREPFGIDELSRDLEIPVSELSVKLSMMEMQGLVEIKQGKYYNKK